MNEYYAEYYGESQGRDGLRKCDKCRRLKFEIEFYRNETVCESCKEWAMIRADVAEKKKRARIEKEKKPKPKPKKSFIDPEKNREWLIVMNLRTALEDNAPILLVKEFFRVEYSEIARLIRKYNLVAPSTRLVFKGVEY